MIAIKHELALDRLGTLIAKEHLGEKLLEKASRGEHDPRDVAHLWTLATESRDHARILRRHRRAIDRSAPEIPYPSWPRGQGPTPGEALDLALDNSRDLAGEYRSSISLIEDPYVRKFLVILSEEHDGRVLQLEGLARGVRLFSDLEDFVTEEEEAEERASI